MLRRELFTSLAAIGAMVGANGMTFRSSATAVVEHESIPPRSDAATAVVERRILRQTCALAGFQYHQGEKLWPHLAPAAPLQLVREPANPYDTLAIRVEWQGQKLGYVPRAENKVAAGLLDRGATLSAQIAAMNVSDDPWQRMMVEIQLVT